MKTGAITVVVAAVVLVGVFIFWQISVKGIQQVIAVATSPLPGITDTPESTVTPILLKDTYSPTFTNSPTSTPTSTPTATFTATTAPTFTATDTTTFTATIIPESSPTPTPTKSFSLGIANFYLSSTDEDCRPGEQIFTIVSFENNKLKVIGKTASLNALRKVQSFRLSYQSMANNANWHELAQGVPTQSESVLYEGPLPMDIDGLSEPLREAKLQLVVTYSGTPATDRGCHVVYKVP